MSCAAPVVPSICGVAGDPTEARLGGGGGDSTSCRSGVGGDDADETCVSAAAECLRGRLAAAV